MDAWTQITQFLESERARGILHAALLLLAAWGAARVILRVRVAKLNAQQTHVFRLVARYTLWGIALMWALRVLGFDFGVLLGAAGILTVALGFASQTSASNLISGLFLMGEQPFVIGDVIRVGDTTGEVLTIGALSVKLRTFDNLSVRIPNETMLKSNVTNLSRFPVRRFDMMIGVAYREDLERVEQVLRATADSIPICLTEPKPVFLVLGFGESSVNMQFSVWATQENFLQLRIAMHKAVKKAFDDSNIEIPFPHRSLYAGSNTSPLPVRIIQ